MAEKAKVTGVAHGRAIIDGDILIHRAAAAAQPCHYDIFWKPDQVEEEEELHLHHTRYKKDVDAWLIGAGIPVDAVEVIKGEGLDPIEDVFHSIDVTLKTILEKTGTAKLTLYFTGKTNFRKWAAKRYPYKGTRASEKPIHFYAAMEYCLQKYPSVMVEGAEADDQLSIEQYKWLSRESKEQTVLCSADKDLNMVPGLHFNWTKGEGLSYETSPEEGLKLFYEQLLKGDRTDNIIGLPGVGDKRAKDFVETAWESTELSVLTQIGILYEDKLGNKEDSIAALIENGQLLWMQTSPGEVWGLEAAERFENHVRTKGDIMCLSAFIA